MSAKCETWLTVGASNHLTIEKFKRFFCVQAIDPLDGATTEWDGSTFQIKVHPNKLVLSDGPLS